MRFRVRQLVSKSKPWFFVLLLLAGSAALFAAGRSKFRRLSNRPLLSPPGSDWESAGAFNPAVVRRIGKIVMLYRAQDTNGTSRIGYAESGDARNDSAFVCQNKPGRAFLQGMRSRLFALRRRSGGLAGAFLQQHDAVNRRIFESLRQTARPANFYPFDLRRRAKPEMHPPITV